jgi:hypothetical protein
MFLPGGPARGWVAAPRGLTYHTIDVFWTELCAVTDGGTELPPSSWPLLDLLLAQTARTRDTRAPFRVRTAFLDPLLSEEPAEGQQAPFAARNPALVVHVATRLGELAKAKVSCRVTTFGPGHDPPPTAPSPSHTHAHHTQIHATLHSAMINPNIS